MRCIKTFFSILCVLVAVSAGCRCAGQAPVSTPDGKAAEILPQPAEIPSPFDLDAPASRRAGSIEFLASESISARDRQTIHDRWPDLEKKAALLGFDLQRGSWIDRQMLCPIFPGHILLLYTRDNGVGDVSEFSAVLPRGPKGPVRIVPSLRRSYSLYTPASSNAGAIAVFNGIRAWEHPGKKADWLTTGLCYAALTGAQVVLPPPVGTGTKSDSVTLEMDPLLQIGDGGVASVQFLDVENPQRPVEWGLDFDRNGKLLSVALTPLPGLQPRIVPGPIQVP